METVKSVFSDEQLEAMSPDELLEEYDRAIDVLNELWDNYLAYQGYRQEADYRYRIDRHYRRWGNLIGRVELAAFDASARRTGG